jgi:hypothetical protein
MLGARDADALTLLILMKMCCQQASGGPPAPAFNTPWPPHGVRLMHDGAPMDVMSEDHSCISRTLT